MKIYGLEDSALPDIDVYVKNWSIDSTYGELPTVTLTCIARAASEPGDDERKDARIRELEAQVAHYKAILE